MFKSIITISSTFKIDGVEYRGYDGGTEEMLIPKVIGKILRGFAANVKLNRLLPVGHRWRGDIE